MGRPPDRPKRGGASLSDEDRALWDQVAGSAKPLKERSGRAVHTAPQAPEKTTKASEGKPLRPRRPSGPSPLIETPRKAEAPSELTHGSAAGVDRRQTVRLRRGQLPIDGTLDLHGDTQAEAHRRLNAYLERAQATGKRCVLVVTGRGLGKAEGGVLRTQVPRWLNLPPNRARVLAFDIAQPKHGGDGALYVLLRRERGKD